MNLTCALMGLTRFETTIKSSNLFYSDSRMTYIHEGIQVGFIHITQLPFGYSVIHSLYIHPHYRNQGYGKALGMQALDLLKKKGGNKIFVQPGPFELTKSERQTIENHQIYESRLQQLIIAYKRAGLTFSNSSISRLAAILYKILGINENAHYLMEIEPKS